MTANQFRIAIEKVGLCQERAGIFFGKSERTGRRWATGEYKVPAYVGRFLLFALHGQEQDYGRRCGRGPKDIRSSLKPPRISKTAADEKAADDDQRSLTSLIEKLLSDYLKRKGYLK